MDDSQVVELPPRTTSELVTPVNTTHPAVQDTPLARKSATQVHAMNAPLSKETYKTLAKETGGHYLVGMKPEEFLEHFLPWNATTDSTYKAKVPTESQVYSLQGVPPQSGKNENRMYGPFVKALDGWVTGIDSHHKLRFAHFTKFDTACASMNVDISTYWEPDFPTIQGKSGPELGSCTFALQQTYEEFKINHTYDAFEHDSDEGPKTELTKQEADAASAWKDSMIPGTGGARQNNTRGVTTEQILEGIEECDDEEDDEEPSEDAQTQPASSVKTVETDTQHGIHTRGQIAAYAGVAMSMAFRTHFFSMLILGRYARFIRWDRRGAIVTKRFDYVKRPQFIFEFYLRFGQLTLSQRGFDTSAVPLDGINDVLPNKIARAFDNYYRRSWHKGAKFSHHRSFSDEPQKPAKDLPFFRITVEDHFLKKKEKFFVPAPAYRETYVAPFARASRRSLAFLDHPEDGKLCFIKDSWQENSQRSAPEADIYRKLHEAGVQHIASMRLGGDVTNLKTKTQDWFTQLTHSGRYKRLGPMVCHRLVLDTVARDLSTFVWCKVLLSCLADAVDAAQQAYKAGVLHRDISAGNVMIVKDRKTKEWRGVLIDWDMCLLLQERDKNHQIRTARTGTWAFISARLLQATPSDSVVHSLGDDMESIFWVLAYEALRYTKNDQAPYELYTTMKALFTDAHNKNGHVQGGRHKINALQSCASGSVASTLADFEVPFLKDIFQLLARGFKIRYKANVVTLVVPGLTPAAPPDTSFQVDWDNPEEKWLSAFLRETAKQLPPFGVTPTGIISPTNDSKPPSDESSWKNALIRDNRADYFEMKWTKDEKNSELSQAFSSSRGVTSGFMNHMDGLSYSSGKRPLDDVDESGEGSGSGSEDPTPANRLKPTA